MADDYQELIDGAKAVLAGNWLGASTKPAPRLYPHQWSWDSAFIAIGNAHFDQARAQQELSTLFKGQWRNGLLPHIVFNPAAADYFPGPEFWKTDRSSEASRDPLTSGIVQPPIHATAAFRVYHHAADKKLAAEFLEDMYPRLVAWHDYLYRERDPNGEGLVYIRHPWESGEDNSPVWDRALKRIALTKEMVPPYRRADTSIVSSKDRPSDDDYDRYAYLVKVFYDNSYDEAAIRKACPFLIQDVLFNSILAQADHDLSSIARLLGKDPHPHHDAAKRTTEAINTKLWNQKAGIYFDFDLVDGTQIDSHVASGFAPLFAMAPSARRIEEIMRVLDSRHFSRVDGHSWTIPSYDKEAPGYSPNRYWRGPIWININWLLFHGLRRYGYHDYARNVRRSIVELPKTYGFYEYFDPEAGKGHGSDNFSWTAALVLDVLLEDEL
jgi:mannosylglycerate hydrolase